MNNKILLTAALISSSFLAVAQQNKTTYAITGDGNNDFVWMNIRQVDLTTGQITQTLFERSKTNFVITDVNTKKSINQSEFANQNIMGSSNYPTSTFVAGAAYDKRSNKLFFTPMRMAELRWLDLNIKNETPQFYSMKPSAFKVLNPNDEATNITRMVIGADGIGYALSNDGNHLFSFTTGKKPVVTDLGNIIDADQNNGVSIHNKCTSWGGDMIADAFGKLYVISASHVVFVIDINSRIATYQGSIKDLPAGYTTNAAAVNDEGDVVVASANMFDGFYKFKMTDLAAQKMIGSDIKYNASDFANANLLFQKDADAKNNYATSKVPVTPITISSDTKVFPNPVTNSNFNILLDSKTNGVNTIIVSDLAGRVVVTNKSSVSKGTQTVNMKMNPNTSKGIYMVKVLDESNTIILNEKIIVQ